MRNLRDECEKKRAELVGEKQRLLQKRQRTYSKLQKSLLAAQAAESEAQAAARADPVKEKSLSAIHQKQNIERRVRLLEQTVRRHACVGVEAQRREGVGVCVFVWRCLCWGVCVWLSV